MGDVAVVGHDSGGLIARHALAGDPRVRSWGLIDTEQPQGPSFRFRSFLAIRVVPRFENLLAYLVSVENTHLCGQIVFVDGGSDVVIRGDSTF